MQIEIKTDQQLVDLIDDIKHGLKVGLPEPRSHMREAFNEFLNEFIERMDLDGDPHRYATLPKKVPKNPMILDEHGKPLPPHVPSEKPPLIKWQCWEYVGVEVFHWVDDLPETVNPLTDLPTIKERDGIKHGDLLIVGSVLGWVKARAYLADGSLTAKSDNGSMLYILEFDRDARHCWTCSGSGNLAALKKLELT